MPESGYFRQRTKIVCTMGPTSRSIATVERMIKAGMNIARFNLAHGSYDEHIQTIKTVRETSQRQVTPIGILIDIPGPKYRVGNLKGGSVTLKSGDLVTLTTKPVEGDAKLIPVTLPHLPQDIRKGDAVVLDDGAMELRVVATGEDEIRCRVLFGGLLTPGRGVVLPGVQTTEPFLTEQLQAHLSFALSQNPDYIALSFVSNLEDIVLVKDVLRRQDKTAAVIAKIERRHAVVDFDKILTVSDGIMVARGDLGVNIPLQKVPLVQKELIRKCNQAGKPVITATQMLLSMVNSPRPTRAEVTDVANAIFDGSDAIMLSNETSVGTYPVPAVRTMAQIARETERHLSYASILAERAAWGQSQTDELISYNACYTASRLGAAAIVAFTQSGSTARRVSKYRPQMPIIALTPNESVCGQLLLSWGVHPVRIPRTASMEDLFVTAASLVKDMGRAKSGDLIVITGGIPVGVTGTTNLLKVERIA